MKTRNVVALVAVLATGWALFAYHMWGGGSASLPERVCAKMTKLCSSMYRDKKAFGRSGPACADEVTTFTKHLSASEGDTLLTCLDRADTCSEAGLCLTHLPE